MEKLKVETGVLGRNKGGVCRCRQPLRLQQKLKQKMSRGQEDPMLSGLRLQLAPVPQSGQEFQISNHVR